LTFASPPNFEVPTDVGGNNVYDVTVAVYDGVHTVTKAVAVTVVDVVEKSRWIGRVGRCNGEITIVLDGGQVHVYKTDTTDDVVPPHAAGSVDGLSITAELT